MPKKKEFDDPTRQAQAWLFFDMMQRINRVIADGSNDIANLDAEAIHLRTLQAPRDIDIDKYDFASEMKRIKEAYEGEAREKREKELGYSIKPRVWNAERRLMEIRAIYIQACIEGVLSEKKLALFEPASMFD